MSIPKDVKEQLDQELYNHENGLNPELDPVHAEPNPAAKLDSNVIFRLTNEEKKALAKYAQSHRMNVSNTVRTLIKEALAVKNEPAEQKLEKIRELLDS